MKKKLSLWFSILVVLSNFIMFLAAVLIAGNSVYESECNNLIQATKVVANIYKINGALTKDVDSQYRISIISKDGNVIADSYLDEVSSLPNHLNRPEIIKANEDEPLVFIRHSDSLDCDMFFYAEKINLSDGDYFFVRISSPASNFISYLKKSMVIAILILIISSIIAIYLSSKVSKKVTQQFSNIKESIKCVNDEKFSKIKLDNDYPEIRSIVQEINDLENKILKQINDAKFEQNKLSSIIANINEGILVLNGNGIIELANYEFLDIFNYKKDCVGKNYLNIISSLKLCEDINEVINNKKIERYTLRIDNNFYLTTLKRIESEISLTNFLVIVILTDITNSVENANMRSEFFANASHELKTPLTVIRGFNDIMAMQNTNENLVKPILQIDKETKRMQNLVNDMLKLSTLENETNFERIEIDLNKIAFEIVDSLKNEISKKGIEVIIEGKAIYSANYNHMFELEKNLIENAVRYNCDNGKINIDIKDQGQKVVFEVRDTGIGIAKEDQKRIFERFYRVEKSRSRQTGGTGLGLAIVKHICILYGADIKIDSSLGKGTIITVIFEK